jgi:hypothetical protein
LRNDIDGQFTRNSHPLDKSSWRSIEPPPPPR